MRMRATFVAVLLWAGSASAALTDSEKAQIAGFVKAGKAEQAGRVRSLVARPDLSAEEAAEPLIAGFRDVPFDAARAGLTESLLFGPGSDAARSTLVPAVVRALLARADRLLGELPKQSAADEIVAIHAFVSERIAGGAKIRDDARKASAEAYQKHLESNAKLLRHGSVLDPANVRVRAQAQLTTVQLAGNLLSKRELSGWLGLDGARRSLFERRGVLIEDGGSGSEPRLDLAARLLEASPRAAAATELWLIHKAPAEGLRATKPILSARTPLGAEALPSAPDRFWPEEVEPVATDARLAEVALSAAWQATRAAFAKQPELSKQAAKLAAEASSAGPKAYLARDLVESRIGPEGQPAGLLGASPELFTAHALRLVLLDAERAATLAASRSLAGRSEPGRQLGLALSVLAHGSDEPAKQLGVGRTGKDGALELVTAGDVKLTGLLVTSFTLGNHRFDLEPKLTIDGKEPKLSKLPLARLAPAAGERFTSNGIEWEKLVGAPRGLAVDDGRFVLAAPEGSSGFDSVVTGKPATDASVRATIKPSGSGGGLLLRAQKGDSSYDAIALLIAPEPAKAMLVLVDGKGRAVELAPPIDLPPPKADGWAVTLSVQKDAVTASVGGKKLSAKLTRAAGSGRAGLTVRAGGRIEVKGVSGSTVQRKP